MAASYRYKGSAKWKDLVHELSPCVDHLNRLIRRVNDIQLAAMYIYFVGHFAIDSPDAPGVFSVLLSQEINTRSLGRNGTWAIGLCEVTIPPILNAKDYTKSDVFYLICPYYTK